MKTVDVLHGNITRSLLSLYFPILICSIIQQLSSMINLMLVGNYMSSFVLGIIGGSASMMVTLFTNPMVALISGSMVCVATAYGEKNTKKTNNAIFTSFVIIAFFTFVYIAIYEFFGTTVLNAFHVPSSQIADASLYIHLYSIGLIFFSFFQLTINILRSIGNVEFPNYILIFSCILNSSGLCFYLLSETEYHRHLHFLHSYTGYQFCYFIWLSVPFICNQRIFL